MNPDHYNAVKKAVIEAQGHDCINCCPDDLQVGTSFPDCASNGRCKCHAIHLSDVIYAYLKSLAVPRYLVKGYISGDRLGAFDSEVMNIVALWNLRKDNLEDQSPETIEFLYEILK